MSKRQSSVVFWIIFLGIIVGIALLIFPKHGRLSRLLNIAQDRNIAAKLTAATATNFAQRKSNSSLGVAINDCSDIMKIIGNKLPADYQIDNQVLKPDKVTLCALQGPNGETVEFNAVGIN